MKKSLQSTITYTPNQYVNVKVANIDFDEPQMSIFDARREA